MCMAWTKRDDVEIDIPEKPSGNGFCCRCEKYVAAKKRSELRTITHKNVIFEYLHHYAYCPHCGENVYVPELNDLNVEQKIKAYHMATERTQQL